MRRLFCITLLLCTVCSSLAQTGEVTLVNVGLDSLRKVVNNTGEYTFFSLGPKSDSSLKLTLSWNQTNFVGNVKIALARYGYSLSQVDRFLFVLKGTGIMTTLPEGFFTTEAKTSQESIAYTTSLTSTENQEIGSVNKVYTIGDPSVVFTGSRAVLSGYVRSIESREPLAGIFVMVTSTGLNVSTDLHGFYRIPIPLGKANLELKGYGLEDTPLMLDVFGDGTLDIVMKEKVYSLRSVVVSAESNQQRRSSFVGVEKILINRIKHIPAAFGEADVMKVVLTLPGVKTVGESSGGFNVRGGATDQNLILFNEGTLYNPTHLFGLFSAFNPDVVSDIELYKSTIPAKYGGRISSVLEVNSRQGNSKKITGSAGIGLLTSKLHLEGPIVKDKTNFIVGARTTYSNWILRLLPENSGYRDGSANFYDFTAGLSQKINNANTVYLYGYYSGDSFSFSKDTSYRYNNVNLAVKWRSTFSTNHSMTLSAGYDRYRHSVEESSNYVNAFEMRFALEQFFVKANFNWLINEKHTLSYGLNATSYNVSPGEIVPKESSEVSPDKVNIESAWESALYVNDKWDITNRFSVDLGIRYTLFSTPQSTNYYHGPEYRVSARYMFDNNLTIKGGFNSMRQNIHMLSNTVSTSPIDIWKLSDAHLVPQTGWQAAAGIYQDFFHNQIEVSLEGYYKMINHYLDYKSGAIINMNKHIEEDVLETTGRAYGVEVMVKKPAGKLNGWLAYSYSKTMLKEAGEKEMYEINGGKWYPASYDKPHDVKVVANYKFTQRYSFSANVDYASGRPVTVPVGVYYYSGGYRLAYSGRNQYRIPDYFRFDVAFNIEPSHNLKLWTHSVITFGVYNVTGRKNAFSVYYANKDNQIKGYKLSVFGAQIPYINYTIKF